MSKHKTTRRQKRASAPTVRQITATPPSAGTPLARPGSKDPVKLHLGCGYQILPGYINIDLYSPAADVKMDITSLDGFEDASVDEIYLNAVFEHLYICEQRKALAEWRRVLKPGGVLRIDSLPDFDEVVRAYINRAPGNGGGVFDIEEVSRYTHGAYNQHDKLGQIHKDVFNKEKICKLLAGAGFEITNIETVCWGNEPNPVNMNVRAVKSAQVSVAPPTLVTRDAEDEDPLSRYAPLTPKQAPSFAAVYCVYDDCAWLRESVASVYDCCQAIYVLVSDRPWHGEPGDCSQTLELVNGIPDPAGRIRLVRGSWNSEAEQRNAGLDMLAEAGYDYCLVIDADEVYDTTDLRRMMQLSAAHAEIDCWHVEMDTYWKSPGWRIDPREPLKPPVFLKVGGARFTENRNVSECVHGLISPEVGFCHHLSYARTDEQILRKISTFSHANEIREGWYQNVWLRWDSDQGIENLHPTHPAAYRRAVRQPVWALPPVLRQTAGNGEQSGDDPRTSIVVLTRNQLEYTRKCLDSIDRWTPEPHEVIVVDNASTDGTVEFLKHWAESGPGRKVVLNESNLGFAAGNNRGMAVAEGEFVLLLNNDVVVTPGWLDRMLACAARSPQVGIVGPMSNSVSGPQFVDQPLYDIDSLSGLDQFAREWAEKHHREASPIWRAVGFCMLIRRSVIDRVGGLDTRFGQGNFEDDDLCLRAAVAGFKCLIARDSFVHHFGSRTFIGERVDYNGLLARNWEIYKQKWGLPAQLRYGAPYSLAEILKQPFDSTRHYCALDEEPGSPQSGLRLSLCMIARNEDMFIGECLESVRGIVDEIVVVDTGSEDSTAQIAREHGASVYSYPWSDDYSEARNESLKHATGDWVLVLDADERLDATARGAIASAIRSGRADAYELIFHNYCRDGSSQPEIVHRVCRLFRNRPEYRFEGRIHENVVRSIAAAGGVIESLDAVVHHYGYRPDVKKKRNKHERYLALLLQDLEEKPDDIYVLHHIGAAYCAEEEFEQAIPHLEHECQVIPPDHAFAGQAFSRLINALWATGRYEEALEAAEQAERKGIRHPEITFSRGNALLALGRHAEATEAFEQATLLGASGDWLGDPGTYGFKARFGMARACVGLGDIERAISLCREVVAEQPDHPHAHEVLALCAEQLGLAEEAEEHWKQVLRLMPGRTEALTHLAELAGRRGRPNEAVGYCLTALKNEPDSFEWHMRAAAYWESAGKADEAEKHYLRAVELKPDSLEALNNLGLILAARGKLQESLDCFTKAVETDPSYANAYFNAGDVLYSAGYYARALEVYQSGLAHDPTRAAGFFTVGNCCFQLGAYEAAVVAYRQALELDPDLTGAANNLSLAEEFVSQQAA